MAKQSEIDLTKMIREAEERGRKAVLGEMHPVCMQTGCKQVQHFNAIRELQALNEKLEEKLRAYEKG